MYLTPKRAVGAGISIVILLATGLFVLSSNLLRTDGYAEFASGQQGLNKLSITGPYGWYCVEHTKVASPTDNGQLIFGGAGTNECPVLGSVDLYSNEFPDSGKFTIPPDQDVMVYQNPDNTYEVWVLITRDQSRVASLYQY